MKTQSSPIRWVGTVGSQFVLAFGLTIASAPAQAEQELPSAEAILDRFVEATGGKQAHLELTTRKVTGKLVVDMAGHNFEAKVETHAQAPDKSHMLIDGDLISQVTASNGTDAWEWNRGHEPGTGVSRLLEGEEKVRELMRGRFHARVHWRKSYQEVETIGIADVRDEPSYEVRVTDKSGAQHSRFYAIESGRLVKYTRPIESPQVGEMDTEVYLSDYREFDGVWMATKVEAILKSPAFGEGTQTWIYTNFEHGLKISPDLFKLPDELKGKPAVKPSRHTFPLPSPGGN